MYVMYCTVPICLPACLLVGDFILSCLGFVMAMAMRCDAGKSAGIRGRGGELFVLER